MPMLAGLYQRGNFSSHSGKRRKPGRHEASCRHRSQGRPRDRSELQLDPETFGCTAIEKPSYDLTRNRIGTSARKPRSCVPWPMSKVNTASRLPA